MPSALEQALQRLDPGAKKAPDDFLTDWWNTTLKYAQPAIQQVIQKATPGNPLAGVGPAMDVLSAPFSGAGNAYVGMDPHATALDRRIGGHLGGMVMPLPGRAEEEAAGALADVGRAGVRRIARRSIHPWDEIHHMSERGVVEDVPIHWLRRLAPADFGSESTFEDRINNAMADIQTNGFRKPVVVRAGTQSRNAVLEHGDHNLNIEAANRLGYTHVPVTIEMSPNAGRLNYGTTHLEEDIIPTHEPGPNQLDLGVDDTRYLKPSDAFKSLQPGSHSDPSLAWAAREAVKSPRMRGYHGTTRMFDKFQETNRPGYAGSFDTQVGTHGGVQPAIAENFSGMYGRIIPVDAPPKEQLYQLEQETRPTERERYKPTDPPTKAVRRLQYDTYSMGNTIAERGFRRQPKLMIPWLKNAVGAQGDDLKLTQMANQLARGWAVQTAPYNQPRTLTQLLREYYVGNLNWDTENWQLGPNDPDFRQQIVQAARESFGQEGFKGYTYLNTAGHELAGATDPTSFTVFDPNELKSPFEGQAGEPLISEEAWKRLMNVP